MKNLFGKTWQEKAQAMVEFALVFPILLLLLYGIIEFGRLLFIYSAVTTSSREAARYGSAAGKGAGVTINLNSSKYNDCEGIRAAARRSAIALSLPDSAIQITYDSGPGTPKIATSCPTPVFNLGDRIVVTVTNAYSPFLPIPFLSDIPIKSTTGRTILKDIRVEGTPVALGEYAPRLSFFVDRAEINESGGTIEVTVMLDTPATKTVTAPISIGGTTASDDYTLSPTSVTIPAGNTYTKLTITVVDDAIDEYDETVILALGLPVNADIGTPNVYTLTILDNDDPPFISFELSSQSVDENVGTPTIMVILTDAGGAPTYSGKPISVNFDATGGTANLPADFNLPTKILNLSPGQKFGFVVVNIVYPDNLDEEDETVQIDLSAPSEAILKAPTQHTVTIIDKDIPIITFTRPLIVIDETVPTVSIPVLMSIPSTRNISVNYTLGGNGTTNVDYRISSSPIVFPAGSTTTTISFTAIKDDLTEEPYETVEITMVAPADPNYAKLGAVPKLDIQIYDTYTAPFASFSTPAIRVAEKSGQFTLMVNLNRYANQDVTVPFSLSGTALTGTGVDDDFTYTPVSGSVFIPVGTLDGSITFNFIADGLDEDDETIQVTMGAPVGASVGVPGETFITLEDSDPTPALYFNGVGKVVAEDAGTVAIPLLLSAPSAKTVTVNFKIAPPPQTTATENVDYRTLTSFTVTFPPKATTAEISVEVLMNPLQDQDPRDLALVLQNPPVNAILGTPSTYTLTIRDVQVCPRFVSASRVNNTGLITLYIANDRNYATDTYIDSVTANWPLATDQTVSQLHWSYPDGAYSVNVPKNTPIVVSQFTWTLLIPGSTPTPPASGYPLEIRFSLPLNPTSTYTITIRFNNGCVRDHSS